MSVNKVILLGNVGGEPKVNVVANTKVANFSLATTERSYTKKDGTKVEGATEWHNIVVWGKLAELIEKYVTKGSQLYLEGHIKTRSYEKDGQKRYVTEIYADVITFVGGKRADQEQAPAAAPVNNITHSEQFQQAQAMADMLGNNSNDLPF